MQCLRKRKPPLPGALTSNGAAYRFQHPLRGSGTGSRPPAGVAPSPAGYKNAPRSLTPAPRPRFESCSVYVVSAFSRPACSPAG